MDATILSGPANLPLSAAVERALGVRFAACTTERFPDGEMFVRLDEPVRGQEVVLLFPTSPPVNDHLVGLLAMTDACRRAGAERIVAFMPYFGYARSDRRDGRRTPIMASLVANLLEVAGVNHVVTLDAHTPALEGYFHVAVDNLSAAPVLADALQAELPADAVIVAPDLGGAHLANAYAAKLQRGVAFCHKHRESGTEVAIRRIVGAVAGHPCVIVDDMISTGGTVTEAIRALRAEGARPDIIVVATHAVFVPGALERLEEAGVRQLFVTDSIALPEQKSSARPHVVSIAPLLATAISRMLEGGSLRQLT